MPAGRIVIGTQLIIENLRFVNLLKLRFKVNVVIPIVIPYYSKLPVFILKPAHSL